jgi:D-tyrosyl-tRNA(Tyr) deacylase
MRGLIQRVTHARVEVGGNIAGQIDVGVLLLLGVQRGDSEADADKLLKKVLDYRIFPDPEGKMNLSLRDIKGELLIVSQFTLAADTKKGLRPSFTPAAAPQEAERLYNYFVAQAEVLSAAHGMCIATGQFGADMQVSLCNDGPVTFLLEP